MNSLLNYLPQFNAKERFFLLGHVLGNPQFTLGSAFKAELSKEMNLSLPEDLFCAMDFHLDWLYAALQLYSDGGVHKVHSNSDGIIKAQQEDIDFLIGYESDGLCHLILLEAKGATGWTNAQMRSKAARLADIFGQDGSRWPGVVPHFGLMSPRPPQQLLVSCWPQWMAPNGRLPWLNLPNPGEPDASIALVRPAGRAALSRKQAGGKNKNESSNIFSCFVGADGCSLQNGTFPYESCFGPLLPRKSTALSLAAAGIRGIFCGSILSFPKTPFLPLSDPHLRFLLLATPKSNFLALAPMSHPEKRIPTSSSRT